MERIRIVGGRPLRGIVRIHGGKNAALPILAATAAIPGRFLVHNCPRIRDVEVMRLLLQGLGIESLWQGDSLLLNSRGAAGDRPDPALCGRMRASVLLMGALLSVGGTARISLPGGCVLGTRPLDLHIACLRELGTEICAEAGELRCRGRPKGGTVFLRYPSVGATENLLLAALGAAEPVRILGAALEPEIGELAAFLSACGAEVQGVGTHCLTLTPGPLHGTEFRIAPDRMETATYLCAAACAGGEITLENTAPDRLKPVLNCLRQAGCVLSTESDRLCLRGPALRGIGPIVTGPYPAFPTDAQAPMSAALLKAAGVSVIEETVFDSRFRHVPALQAMGAQIELAGRTARIRGVDRLHGAVVTATDLRGGAAMLIAALGAEGESLLNGAELLERGYQDLIESLRAIGAQVTALPAGQA